MSITAMGTFPIFDEPDRTARPIAPASRRARRIPSFAQMPAEAWICTAIAVLSWTGWLAPTWQ